VTQRPELVDDFVRNFLVRMNMHRTLDCFQTEWQVLSASSMFSATVRFLAFVSSAFNSLIPTAIGESLMAPEGYQTKIASALQ